MNTEFAGMKSKFVDMKLDIAVMMGQLKQLVKESIVHEFKFTRFVCSTQVSNTGFHLLVGQAY